MAEDTALEIFDSLSVVLLVLPSLANSTQAAMMAAARHMISSTDQLVRLADMRLGARKGSSRKGEVSSKWVGFDVNRDSMEVNRILTRKH